MKQSKLPVVSKYLDKIIGVMIITAGMSFWLLALALIVYYAWIA
jgi:hypothetical protein